MKRAMGMLGLCARAGKLISGEKACLKTIRSSKACVVLMDATAAKNTEKSITDACAYHEVPLLRTPEYILGNAIGKPGRMVVAVIDPGFARQIIQLNSGN
ncbi:MAG: ribosomal L7Ae/L30e/S12e/Gadd45 family protein [Christensenellales bacterium]|nr:ribosomal L7Ae/L30e/S12e/Gadd45 family protein [Christensenellales bacterium]